MRSILDRYLFREAAAAWLAVTLVLLGIMLSTRFARFVAQAASGDLPKELLFKVVGLSSLQYLVLLIPVSLMLAILLALGRMYKDQEISVIHACGRGIVGLAWPLFTLGLLLAFVTGALSLYFGPWAGRHVDFLLKDARRLVQFTPFEPGRFKEVAEGRAVFYTGSLGADGRLKTIFAHVTDPSAAGIITAETGEQRVDPRTGEREVLLRHGYRYQGEAGRADFDVVRFAEYGTRVAPPDFIYVSGKRKIQETRALIGSPDPQDQAELQWRLSAPLSVMILGLLAVPLAHISPRQGRYGKLVLGLVAYLVYSNLLGLAQTWAARGVVPVVVGVWWVHALFFGLAAALIARREGWFGRRLALRRAAP